MVENRIDHDCMHMVWRIEVVKLNPRHTRILFGFAVQPVFHQIFNFFFAKIECGLYLLDRFDMLMSKIIF